MKKDSTFDILKIATSTRMLELLGEGELEIKNQGRFGYSTGFTQETGARGQQTPRIGDERPKRRELSAGCTLNSDSTPHFLFYVFPWLDNAVFAHLRRSTRLIFGRRRNQVKTRSASGRRAAVVVSGASTAVKIGDPVLRLRQPQQSLTHAFLTTKSRSRKWGLEQGSSSRGWT